MGGIFITVLGTLSTAWPLSGDNAIQADGQLHYKVFGSEPNRMLVVEWKSFRIPYSSTLGTGSTMQVWLYEGTNVVKYVYGTMYNNQTSDLSRGIVISNSNIVGSVGNIINITTAPAWDVTSTSIMNSTFPLNSVMPNLDSAADGSRRVFSWTPSVANNPPNPAQCVSPANGATGIITGANLNWSSGGGSPAGYYVYFGTDGGGTATPTNIVNGVNAGATNTYDVPDMAFFTTYYWQIVPYNTYGNATGCPIWSFTTGGPVVLMTNGSITLNPGDSYSFFDSGGSTGAYQNSENYTFTFNAPANYAIRSSFNSFASESGYDYLRIYDGPTTADPLLGSYTGTVTIPMFISSHATGALTFNFTSDSSVTYAGWDAVIDLQNLAGPPNAALPVSPINGATMVSTGASLNWVSGGGAPTGYDLYFGTTNPPAFIGDMGNVTTWNPPTMTNETMYYWQVVPYNAYGDATGCPVWSFTTAPEGLVNISIGTGTDVSPMLPINAFYGYTYSQSIFLASEIGIPGVINAISYYWNGAAPNTVSNGWTVYMGHTPNSTFASTSDWLPLSSLSQVFSGTVDAAATPGWIIINLTTPFAYDGTNNLVIAVDENTGGYDSPYGQFYCTDTAEARSLLYYSDGTNPDPAAPEIALYIHNAFPNVILTISGAPTGPVMPPILAYPANGALDMPQTGFPYQFNWNSGGSFPDVYNLYIAPVADLPENFTSDEFFGVATLFDDVNSPYTPAFTYTHNAHYVWTVGAYSAAYPDEVYQWPPYEFVIENEVVPGAIALSGSVVGGVDASLSWMPWDGPTSAPGWIYWGSGVQNDAIGTGGAAEFSVAQKFPTSILGLYNGDQLTSVRFFPYVDGATYTIRLWTGTDADLAPVTQVYEQAVTTYTANAWNEVALTTPYPITNANALYIGYYVNTTAGYPAGCDAGPQVAGLGNLIEWSGTWSELTALNASLTYNWCIQGYVSPATRTASSAPQISIPVVNKPFNPDTMRNNGFTSALGTVTSPTRVLQGYNVYRDGSLLNTAGYITGTTYYDAGNVPGIHNYQVEAVYVTTSVWSNIVPLSMSLLPPYTLPFNEGWNSGLYTTQNWYTSASNWVIDTINGEPAPCASFSWSPQITNYETYLTSHNLIGAGHSNIWLSFDFALNNYSTDAENWFAVEVWNGTTWNTLQTWSSFEEAGAGWGWTYCAFDITPYAAGHDFKIRFKTTGEDSYEINYWYLDNVNVYEAPASLAQPELTTAWDGTNVNLNWTTIPGAIWYGIYGTADPYGAYTFLGSLPATYIGANLSPTNMQFFKVTAGAGALPVTRGQRLNSNPIESIINK